MLSLLNTEKYISERNQLSHAVEKMVELLIFYHFFVTSGALLQFRQINCPETGTVEGDGNDTACRKHNQTNDSNNHGKTLEPAYFSLKCTDEEYLSGVISFLHELSQYCMGRACAVS